MKKTTKSIPLLFAFFTLLGSSPAISRPMRADRTMEDEDYLRLMDFECKSASSVLKESARNDIYSPLGLFYILSIFESLSGNEALEELESITKFTDEEIRSFIPQTSENIRKDLDKFIISNSIWYPENGGYRKEAFEKIKSVFELDIFPLNDYSEQIASQVCNYIEKKTDGFLKLNPSDLKRKLAATDFLALNTLYFQGEWFEKFEKKDIRSEMFLHETGESENVSMMNKTYTENVYIDSNFMSTILPYRDGAKMLFLLPTEETPLNEILTDANLERSIRFLTDYQSVSEEIEINPYHVELKLPKFSVRSSFSLNDHIKSLGGESIFHSSTSNFESMMQEGYPFCIQDIFQESLIEVDENGTKVASATFAAGCGASAPMPLDTIEFYLNRPFAYAILSATDIPLFFGTYR